jgi:hypothetical protein
MQFAHVAFFMKIPNYLLALRVLRVFEFFVAAGFAAGVAPFAGVTAALLAL